MLPLVVRNSLQALPHPTSIGAVRFNVSPVLMFACSLIVDYRKKRNEHAPIFIDSAEVEQVESFMFLGVHITNKLTWSKHTKPVMKRARLNLLPLKRHPAWLHHCIVWQLLGLRSQGTTEGSAYGPVHHWGQASCHPGPLYQAVSEEGPKNCQRLQPP